VQVAAGSPLKRDTALVGEELSVADEEVRSTLVGLVHLLTCSPAHALIRMFDDPALTRPGVRYAGLVAAT
jgi:hypothetical protein